MNKTILITGASSDFGCEFIQKSEQNYDRILAHYCHMNSRLEQLKQTLGDKLVLLQADFSKTEDVNAMIAQIKDTGEIPQYILHFPAPKAFNQKFHKEGWEQFEEGLMTSLRSFVLITKAFIPNMMKNKFGKIVVMLTAYTLNMPPKYQSSYVTVKYALLGLVKSLAVEYADKGITVNGVSPDMTETKFLENIPELIVQQNASKNPMGRNLTVEDVIPSIEYLLSDAANLVTGQNLGITCNY